MKKRMLVGFSGLAIVLLSLLFTGCESIPVYEHEDKIKLQEREYTILGRVEYKGTWRSVLGIAWGGASFNKLYEKAKEEFGADDVVNVSIDVVDSLWLGLYNQATCVMTGMAVKYK